jgi:hypothetical protein
MDPVGPHPLWKTLRYLLISRLAGTISLSSSGQQTAAAMARHYVHENWTHDRARIHKGECGYCNDGRGTHAGSSPRNGKWHGPLEREDAFRLATRLKRADTKACPICAP